MKQKSIIYSVLLIASIFIISLFVWTASAVGNTENKDKNTDNVIENTDSVIEDTDNINESLIEDTDEMIDDTSNSFDDIGDMIDYANNTTEDMNNMNGSKIEDNNTTEDINNMIDDTGKTVDNTENITDGTDNTIDGTDNTIDSTDNIINDVNNSVDETNNLVYETNNSVDEINNSVDETNNSVDETNNSVDETNNSIDETNNTTDGTDNTTNGVNNSVDDPSIPIEDPNIPIEDPNVSIEDPNIPIDNPNNPIEDPNNAGTKSLELTVNEPSTDSVCTNNVLFNFSADDKSDNNLTYTIYINDTERSTGAITEGECKEVEINLDNGYYTWKVEVKDSLGNIDSSETTDLCVGTKEPTVKLISPEDYLVNTGGPLNFSFTADNALNAQYKDKNLTYEVDVDGNPIEGLGSGTMSPGECIQTQDITNLSDGAHDWSVYIEDNAGNNITSDSRTFYVDKKGVRVSLVSPNNEHVSSANPIFKFRVSGGTGLTFNYTLLVDGKEVKRSTCDGSENNTLELGEDTATDYSIEASVSDGEDKAWTVNITDCAGNNYEPAPYHFSLDTADPGRVSNLSVRDALGETQWSNTHDSPGLYVSWNSNAGGDLASTPYDVFISDFEPHSLEGMEKVKSTSDTSSRIEKYGGNPLEYGKDYWVAVIARDKLGNYNKYFVAICGPVQTYEDMNITLDPGWNMKSVPKSLLESNSSPESVFGKNSTILYWNGTSWEVPKTIEPCKGYWVYSPEAFENNVKFKPIPSDNASLDTPASLDLAPGWQMIGSTSMQPVAWPTTLASLENSDTDYKFSNLITYSHNEGWNGVIPGLGLTDLIDGNLTNGSESVTSNGDLINDSVSRPVGMLQNEGLMVPGQGYWVYINKEGTYNSPESDGTASDVPIDNSMNDNTAVDNGNTDNGTTGDGTADDGTADVGTADVPIDNSMNDNTAVDNGNTDNGNNTDSGTTDIGNANDIPVSD